jgi:serine/threonine-protein kinase
VEAPPVPAPSEVPNHEEAADLGSALAGPTAPKGTPKTVRRRFPVRAIVKAPEPAPAPAAVPVAAPPPAAEPPKDDCNPPYYYEGDKKIFKPSCI